MKQMQHKCFFLKNRHCCLDFISH